MDKKSHGKFALLCTISENTSQCFTNSIKNSGFPSLQAVIIIMVGDKSSRVNQAKEQRLKSRGTKYSYFLLSSRE